MNGQAAATMFGAFVEPTTLHIQRLLPGPVERVWAYLVDGELRRKWLAGGPLDARAGGAFSFVWRNDDLTRPPGTRPEGVPEEITMDGQVLAIDAPHRLEISWGDSGGSVLFELDRRGERVMLTIVHRRLAERGSQLNIGAGWHMHLDIMAAVLAGDRPPSFWDGWGRLRAAYEQHLPA